MDPLSDRLFRYDADAIFSCFYGSCARALEYVGRHFCDMELSDSSIKGIVLSYMSENNWERLKRKLADNSGVKESIIELSVEYFQEKRDSGLCRATDVCDITDCNIAYYLDGILRLHKDVIRLSLCEGKVPRDIYDEIRPLVAETYPCMAGPHPNYNEEAGLAYAVYILALEELMFCYPDVDFKGIERGIVSGFAKAMIV